MSLKQVTQVLVNAVIGEVESRGKRAGDLSGFPTNRELTGYFADAILF
jgi:hypothetical protein